MSAEELIFGIHAVTAILEETPFRIATLYVLQGRDDQRLQAVLAAAEAQGIKPQLLTRAALDALVPDGRHQGVIARCRVSTQYTENDIESLLTQLTVPPFLLILDGIQDPHNLGACLRSANAAGVHIVIAPRDRSVGLTPVVRKVACGAAEMTPFIQVTNLARTLRFLKDQGVWLYGMAEEGTSSLYQTDLRGALGLVLGAEGAGLRRLTRECCDNLLSIPMHGAIASLNVSVATGVCLFEAVRQRI